MALVDVIPSDHTHRIFLERIDILKQQKQIQTQNCNAVVYELDQRLVKEINRIRKKYECAKEEVRQKSQHLVDRINRCIWSSQFQIEQQKKETKKITQSVVQQNGDTVLATLSSCPETRIKSASDSQNENALNSSSTTEKRKHQEVQSSDGSRDCVIIEREPARKRRKMEYSEIIQVDDTDNDAGGGSGFVPLKDSNPKFHQCGQCKKKYKYLCNLRSHEKVHANEFSSPSRSVILIRC